MNKIALTGISGSGKDYVCSILESKYSYVRVSFSDQLKKICKHIFPWMKLDYAPIEKETPLNIQTEFGEYVNKTPRDIWLSLDILRQIDKNVFIRGFIKEIEQLDNNNIVVSDIRTKEEYDLCIKLGFKVVFIEPTKKIYADNIFDDFSRGLKVKCNHIIKNNFNGVDGIINQIQRVINNENN
jgi:dephospho-CoA kinase